MKKKIALYMCLIVGLFLLTGCGKLMENAYRKVIDHISDKFFPIEISCEVYSVPGTVGAYDYICQNTDNIYLYHNKTICKYESMEKVFAIDDLHSMVCTDDALYYYTGTNGGSLWRYDFIAEMHENVSDEFYIHGMKANGKNAFVVAENKTSGECSVLAFCGKQPVVNLNEWITDQEPISLYNYLLYQYDGCNVLVNRENGQIVLIEKGDDFQYSCAMDGVYAKVNEEYIHLRSDITYTYKGEIVELTAITAESKYDAGFSPSQVGIVGGDVYILEQYGKGHLNYHENPSGGFKDKDVLFKLSPETGECELLYKCERREQLIGFSAEKNCVYLMVEDEIYQHNLDNAEREFLLKAEDTRMMFETMNGQMFFFQYYYAVEKEVDLLMVVE